ASVAFPWFKTLMLMKISYDLTKEVYHEKSFNRGLDALLEKHHVNRALRIAIQDRVIGAEKTVKTLFTSGWSGAREVMGRIELGDWAVAFTGTVFDTGREIKSKIQDFVTSDATAAKVTATIDYAQNSVQKAKSWGKSFAERVCAAALNLEANSSNSDDS